MYSRMHVQILVSRYRSLTLALVFFRTNKIAFVVGILQILAEHMSVRVLMHMFAYVCACIQLTHEQYCSVIGVRNHTTSGSHYFYGQLYRESIQFHNHVPVT